MMIPIHIINGVEQNSEDEQLLRTVRSNYVETSFRGHCNSC